VDLLGDSLLGMYGDGLDSTSGLFLSTQQKLTDFKITYTIRGGMDRLPLTLAARYRDRIHYGCEVVSIRHDARSVQAVIRRAGSTSRLEADFLVAAIPYATLRRVRISPPLSSGKRRVVTKLPNTSVLRAYVQCRERFWDAVDPSGTVFTDIPGLSIFSGYTRPSRRGVLEAYISGAPARKLSVLRDPSPALIRMLAKVFPALPDFAEHVVWHSWDDDVWARGAYAWYAPGDMVAFLPDLARPDGRIHFAGDHTSLLPGWIEGAIESGARVAEEIRSAR
jgi:monoamine oxidase